MRDERPAKRRGFITDRKWPFRLESLILVWGRAPASPGGALLPAKSDYPTRSHVNFMPPPVDAPRTAFSGIMTILLGDSKTISRRCSTSISGLEAPSAVVTK